MVSKEAFKMIVAATTLKTGLNQEELAIGMGYGKNYISEMLTPTGKLSMKFIRAFQLKYGDSENPKQEDKKEADADPLSIIASLSESNRLHAAAYLKMAEAQLLLANKINSGASGLTSQPVPETDELPRKDLEILPLGKTKVPRSVGKKDRQRDTVKSVHK